MSSASFSPHSFLCRIRPELLVNFLSKHDLEFKYNTSEEKNESEKIADQFLKLVEKQSEKKQAAIIADIHEVDDMSTNLACDYMLLRARDKNVNINEKEYEELENVTERVLWFFVNHEMIFYETTEDYGFDMMQGWRGIKTVSRKFKDIESNLKDLKAGLQYLYRKEYKGKMECTRYIEHIVYGRID